MANKNGEHGKDGEEKWISPKKASEEYGVPLRTIYNWMGRGLVGSQGENRTRRINANDIEELQRQQYERATADQFISGPEGEPASPREMRNALALRLNAIETERHNLLARIDELSEARFKDREQIGRLQGELARVDDELGRLREDNTRLSSEAGRYRESASSLRGLVVTLVVALIMLAIIFLIVFFITGR